MSSVRKLVIIILILILTVGLLLGLKQVKATGKILIPTAIGNRSYKATFTITKDKIEIECRKKIFRCFNDFESPMYRKLEFNTEDIEEITIDKNNILIFPCQSLYQRYRNIFHPIMKFLGFFSSSPYYTEMQGIIFTLDNVDHVKAEFDKFFKVINNQCSKPKTGCGLIIIK
jgi:hypothetical protein